MLCQMRTTTTHIEQIEVCCHFYTKSRYRLITSCASICDHDFLYHRHTFTYIIYAILLSVWLNYCTCEDKL